jgi:hypothetical protein
VPEYNSAKCELRDVISNFPWFFIKACYFHSRKKVSYSQKWWFYVFTGKDSPAYFENYMV